MNSPHTWALFEFDNYTSWMGAHADSLFNHFKVCYSIFHGKPRRWVTPTQDKSLECYFLFIKFLFFKNMSIDITSVSSSKFVKSIKSGISLNPRSQNNDLHCEANKGENLPLTFLC